MWEHPCLRVCFPSVSFLNKLPAGNIIPGIFWASRRRGALPLSPLPVFSPTRSAPTLWLQVTPNETSGRRSGDSPRDPHPAVPAGAARCPYGGGCSPGRQIPAGDRRSNPHFHRCPRDWFWFVVAVVIPRAGGAGGWRAPRNPR